jgi:hypothetical protein
LRIVLVQDFEVGDVKDTLELAAKAEALAKKTPKQLLASGAATANLGDWDVQVHWMNMDIDRERG